jgi:PAS domain S-box-containing protein
MFLNSQFNAMTYSGKTQDWLPCDSLRRLAFDNEIVATIICRASGEIVMANTAAKILFGYSEAELGLLKRADLFAPGSKGNLTAGQIAKESAVDIFHFIRKNGEIFIGKTSVKILPGNNDADYVCLTMVEINQQQPELVSVNQ